MTEIQETGIPYGAIQQQDEQLARLVHKIQENKYDKTGRKISGEIDPYISRAYNLETLISLANLDERDLKANYYLDEILTRFALRMAPPQKGLDGVIQVIKGRKLMEMKQSNSKKGFGLRNLSTSYNVSEQHQKFSEEKKAGFFDRFRGGNK